MNREAMRPMALLATVATMLIGTTLLTLSHVTVSLSGVGSLKCYTTTGMQKAC